jgi:hypothetical protein
VIIDGVWIWYLIYWHNSELQVISAIADLHTLQITSSPTRSVFNSRFLVTDLNIGDSSASRTQVLPVRRISCNRTLSIQFSKSKSSQSHIATDGQSVSQSVLVSSPTWGSWPHISFSLTVTVLSLWGALSDERTDLSFVRVIVSSNKSVVRICIIFTYYYVSKCMYVCMYIYTHYIQGLHYSRLSTADHAISSIAPATTAV